MSEADAYYDSLIAQGYPPHEALPYTQQHYPHFAGPRLAAPTPPQQQVVYAPVLTGLPTGQAHALTPTAHEASKMGWVTLGLMVASLVLAIYAVNSAAWMSGEVEEGGEVVTIDMGLSKMRIGMEGFGIPIPYDSFFCHPVDWCGDAKSAGTAGQAGLAIGILALGGASIMTFMKQQGKEVPPFAMMLGLVGSLAIIIGAMAWYTMFPTPDDMVLEFIGLDLSLGIAFYAAIIAGVLGIAGSVTSLMD